LPATDPSVQNQFLLLRAGTAGNAGDFDIFTTSGDPDTPRDDNLLISAGAATIAKLRILTANDGTALTAPRDLPLIGGASPVVPGSDAGTSATTLFLILAAAPDADRAGFTTIWQTTPPTNNPAGGISIRQNVRLLRHVVQVSYEIQNNDNVSRTLGLSLSLDNSPNDHRLAAPGPQVGGWVVPGFSPVLSERTFSISNLPSQVFAIGDINDPVRNTFHILRGIQATPPDLFQIVNDAAPLIAAVPGPFAYVTNSLVDARVNPMSNMVWNPLIFTPGQKRTFTTYFGLPIASGDFSPPYVLAAQSPIQLQLRSGDDPLTAQTEVNYVDPNPFTIRGFIFNTSQVTYSNINLTLTLPSGLELAPGESPVKVIPTARPLQDVGVEWRVRVLDGVSGTLTYSITSSTAGAIPKTTTRIVNVPSLAQGILIQAGVQMMTFPYTFANADVASVLVDQNTGSLGPIQVARWNPILNRYEFYPADFSVIEPGRSYWIRVERPFTLRLNGASPLSTTDPFLIPLKSNGGGWNMIGNPFLFPLFIGAMQVSFNNQLLDFDQAVQRELIRNTLFYFDLNINNYRLDTGQTRRFEPRRGYWIRALRDVTLVIPPATILNSIQLQRTLTGQPSNVTTPSPLSVSAGGWQLQVSAVTREGQDPDNFVGVSPDARDEFDPQDIEEPPPMNLPVVVNFPHADWGGDAGKFARDLRAVSAGTKTWDMMVETNLKSAGPVTLNFPNLNELPGSLRVSLLDLSTNRTMALRSRRAYTFQAAAGATAHPFRIIVETGGTGGTLRFGNIAFNRARASNTGVVTFSVTKSAKVQCVLLSAQGKVVRVLANNFQASPGLNTLTFDGKSQQGAALGRGVYIFRFSATSEDEETTGAVKVVNMK
jgi:hypothetical protein